MSLISFFLPISDGIAIRRWAIGPHMNVAYLRGRCLLHIFVTD